MSFPRQYARTRRFTLGRPRGFKISPDGERVAFLRSRGGDDPVTCLWTLDVGTGQERLLADPRDLDLPGEEDLPPQERARRERAREQAGGIVGFATDARHSLAAFALSGRLFVTPLTADGTEGPDQRPGGQVLAPPATVPVFDPRPDPTGSRVAYVSGGALHVVELTAAGERAAADRVLAAPETDQVTYGLAEFIAAEEMERLRGYWWAPDGMSLLVCRVDESPVRRWHIADPAHPEQPPAAVAYPAAGTPNADVQLAIVRLDGAPAVTVGWDRESFPYLVTAGWFAADRGADGEGAGGAAGGFAVVQTRDQTTMRLLAIDPGTGATEVVREDTDPEWVDIVTGVPARTASGALVWTADSDGARRLVVADRAVTPDDLQVRSVLGVDGEAVLFSASTEPTEVDVWLYEPGAASELRQLTRGGVFSGCRAGGTTVVTGSVLDRHDVETWVLRTAGQDEPAGPGQDEPETSAQNPAAGDAGPAGTALDRPVASIASHAATPGIDPRVRLLRAGSRELRTAVLLPAGYEPDDGPLPVLMDPYGGPHSQRVLAANRIFYEPQWFADQGFAVVVADGRGTPGRGPAWDRAVRGDLAGPPLDDQVEALRAAAERFPLDLGRVAIRGWSFGGYLAALAVLRRPDVFHAAVAGAPVTDWRLYDTHYTERYLGHPDREQRNYDACSLLHIAANGAADAAADAAGAAMAGVPTRPLLLIHGLADDNVVSAHTLRLSSALLAAGRPHSVLPLSGVTHMTPQEVVAENLLLLQVEFLREALAPARDA